MILHPAILALSVGSIMACFLTLRAAFYGVRILRHWNLESGSEIQLELEKETYLISTVMSFVLVYELCSFVLFIFTADKLAPLFVGAMCAAGTLNVNVYGYPALLVKVLIFVLGGAWLILNYTDNRAIDYPLIRKKYFLLLLIAPVMVLDLALQSGYFLKLSPHVITSCCGSIFNSNGPGLVSAFVTLPIMPMKLSFYSAIALSTVAGVVFYRSSHAAAGFVFALLSVAAFVISVASLISFISLYFYALPTHHCPFCILQKEYHYVGYALYLTLLGGLVAGSGAGALLSARRAGSLKDLLPAIQRKLVLASLVCYLAFAAIASAGMLFSEFRLEGY
jgi:hypothetical protein